ncbi:MAG: hypothetical protein GXP54_01040, partial [Deltaproteobacteria bacterium]|nr:hypothetical protein [Deltaproteobacteria bacterium]
MPLKRIRHALPLMLCAVLWACGGGSDEVSDAVIDHPDAVSPEDSFKPPADSIHDSSDDSADVDIAADTGTQDAGMEDSDPGDSDDDAIDSGHDAFADSPDSFDPGPPPCTQDSDCDDFDQCTADS